MVVKAKPLREKGIETAIRVALACEGILVLKHHVNNAAGPRTGLGVGVPDLLCVVPPTGRLACIEVKRPGYTARDVRDVQRRFLAMVTRFGAVAGVASSVEEAMAIIERARSVG